MANQVSIPNVKVNLCIISKGRKLFSDHSIHKLPKKSEIDEREFQESKMLRDSIFNQLAAEPQSLDSSTISKLVTSSFKIALSDRDRAALQSSSDPYCMMFIEECKKKPFIVPGDPMNWKSEYREEEEDISVSTEAGLSETVGTLNNEKSDQPQASLDDFQLSNEQSKLLQEVQQLKLGMENLIDGGSEDDTKYRHVILSGQPGLGKTHFVKSLFKRKKLEHVQISGSVSLFALGVSLAILNARRDPEKTIYIHIDDSDVIFKDEETCNIFKQVLFDNQEFIYEKSLRALLPSLDESQREAVEMHRSENGLGFRIPLKNVVFIITTNIPLPPDREISRLMGKNGLAGIKVHRNAIRSRCRYRELNFNDSMRWAWIADVYLGDKHLEGEQKKLVSDMLKFLWDFRSQMQEHSIRTAQKMIKIAQANPQNYPIIWKNEFL